MHVFRVGASQVALVVKNPPANAGDIRELGSIPGLGRFLGGGQSNPLNRASRATSVGLQRVRHNLENKHPRSSKMINTVL